MPIEQEVLASLDDLSLHKLPAEEATLPHLSPKRLAYLDLKEGLTAWRVWLMLAYQDIQLRYRRSILGPFWITLSMAITVYSMGFLYGHLFHIELQQYYPFLVSGMLTWTLISSIITELTDTFIIADSLIKQIKLPYSLYIHRVIARNLLIFFHNLLVMVPIFIIFPQGTHINQNSLFLLLGLIVIYLNAFIFGLILAMIGARYRDISQIIRSLMQVIFFITPIMWAPLILPAHDQIFVFLNPFYSFVELIRAPLIGLAPTWFNIGVTLAITLIGTLVCASMFARYRARIIYWL